MTDEVQVLAEETKPTFETESLPPELQNLDANKIRLSKIEWINIWVDIIEHLIKEGQKINTWAVTPHGRDIVKVLRTRFPDDKFSYDKEKKHIVRTPNTITKESQSDEK